MATALGGLCAQARPLQPGQPDPAGLGPSAQPHTAAGSTPLRCGRDMLTAQDRSRREQPLCGTAGSWQPLLQASQTLRQEGSWEGAPGEATPPVCQPSQPRGKALPPR